jgi:hypothetical protein
MSKSIPKEIIDEFNDFCAGCDDDRFSTFDFDPLINMTDDDGEPLWEFHASNYSPDDKFDIYSLFEQSSYNIEQHGYDEFYIVGCNS